MAGRIVPVSIDFIASTASIDPEAALRFPSYPLNAVIGVFVPNTDSNASASALSISLKPIAPAITKSMSSGLSFA
jgi:hypothetical protein